jgi:3-oxoacyl-[acyl-carrier-protein] synthase II
MDQGRVVITGIGIVSPAGIGRERYWDAIVSGTSCVTNLTRFTPRQDTTRHCQVAAEIKDFSINQFTGSKIRKYMDRAGGYAVAAALDCLSDAHFDDTHPEYAKLDLYMGSCCGAQEWVEREFRRALQTSIKSLHPHTSILAHPGNVIGLVTIVLGIRGRGLLFSNLDSSGVDALTCGIRLIKSGISKRVLIGAADAPLTPGMFSLLDEGGLLTRGSSEPAKASRPFDLKRDGVVLGEGAVMLLIENAEAAMARGAHIYAEIAGHFVTLESEHNSNGFFSEERESGCRAISQALKQANILPEQIDYINANGCSLPRDDRREASIITRVFSDSAAAIPVSSIKSTMGYALSVAGLMQAATCSLTFEHGALPPLINYDYPDPDCNLNFVVGRARPATPAFVLQNTYSLLQRRDAAVIFARPGGAHHG